MSINEKTPSLFLSLPYPCNYLPGNQATTLFVDPGYSMEEASFSHYTQQGFRRSGNLIYRPQCRGCQSCASVRVPVAEFAPSRSQRRTWLKNQNLDAVIVPGRYSAHHFDLYRRYQANRHPDSSMNNDDPSLYEEFLFSRFANTHIIEFHTPAARGCEAKLIAAAVIDVLPSALSAVYTFFDPDLSARGLGIYAVLWQIAHAQHQGLKWVYLGYWIENCVKMDYKANFRPLQVYRNRRWQTL